MMSHNITVVSEGAFISDLFLFRDDYIVYTKWGIKHLKQCPNHLYTI